MNEGRIPPHNIEAEQAVLGACLISPRTGSEVAARINGEVWFHQHHALIWAGMEALMDGGTVIDQITLCDHLKTTGQLDKVGGLMYVATLASEVATAANAQYHVNILLDCWNRRRLIALSEQAINNAHDEPALSTARTLEGSLLEIAEDAGPQGAVISMEEAAALFHDKVELAMKNPGALLGLDTGFTSINKRTCGFEGGQLIILAARPGVGKTSLGLQLARNMVVRNGVHGMFFSCEMSTQELVGRMLSSEAQVGYHTMRQGTMNGQQLDSYAHALGVIAKLKIQIDDTGGISLAELRAKARRVHQRTPLGFIVVDYLQLMSGGGSTSRDNREQEVSKISRGLKSLAKELKVPVIALSQLSRKPEERADKRPQLSDLRDSGAVEQDADMVIFLFNPKLAGLKVEPGEEKLVELIWAKQRSGPTGSEFMVWEGEFTTFRDEETRFQEPASGAGGSWYRN